MSVWSIEELVAEMDNPDRPYNYLMDDPKNREALESYAKRLEGK